MARIRVPGQPIPQASAPDLGVLGKVATTHNVKAARVGAVRAGEKPVELDGLHSDTIVELTLDTGARFYHRYDQLAADMPRSATRGGGADGETLDLSPVLPGPATRGGRDASLIEAVRTFDLDLGGLAGLAGKHLAAKFDQLLMPDDESGRNATGLWGWSPEKPFERGAAPPDLARPGPLLLMIHGTGSSTAGGFEFMTLDPALRGEPWRKQAVEKLKHRYGERMAALEHKTLSVSPIANAIDLLSALPGGQTLHIVTHSRGGMVGELLCRTQRTDGKTPFEGEIEGLKRWGERRAKDAEFDAAHYEEELQRLKQLERLLVEKRPVVERFVRVACPAAGTTLASGRLDNWLSLATSVLDLTGLGASTTYQFLRGFLLAVVKSRTDPRSVPGLEAMFPNSLLTLVLNRPGVETAADLSVIAGDTEGSSRLARLGVKVVDWFYGGDHDLVVDTISMYGGITRAQPGARFFFDKGGEINHFHYFRNQKTLGKLVDALLRKDDEDAGFTHLDRAQEIGAFLSSRRAAGPQPCVFVVPDCMGSHLALGGNRIWIDLPAIARGDLTKLSFDTVGVTHDALVAEAYGDLVQHLSGTHDVKPFPYDWRRSALENGARLASDLKAQMAMSNEPVRILAHGAGGLVALAALASNKPLCEQLAQRQGSRVLLLGTDLRGSPSAARLLLGEDLVTAYLALLDFSRSQDELAAMFRGFPGLLELLPETLDVVAGGLPVDARLLAQARDTRDRISGLGHAKLPFICSVAATGPSLSAVIRDGHIRFRRSAAAAPVSANGTAGPAWYAPGAAADLVHDASLFAAYADLLASGSTASLPKSPPEVMFETVQAAEIAPEAPSIYPDTLELATAALGGVRKLAPREEPRTEVRIVHGNLAFARWPVAIGHYEGDVLAGSEAQLDRALGGRLSRRRDLHIYPGAIGTAEIVLDRLSSTDVTAANTSDQTAVPPGAIVIGLGRVGELTPGDLRRTLSRALRRYALAAREARMTADDQIGLSMVLIGTGEGGVGMRDAVAALLDAVVRANSALESNAFAAIEIFELYEDRAIQAAHAINFALKTEQYRRCFTFRGQVKRGVGGRRQAAPQEDPSWWRRLQVKACEDGALRFTDLTDRARLPVDLVASQRDQVNEFIEQAVTRWRANEEFPASETLFELLLPTRLKQESRDDRNVVFVLDPATASYPWELLRRRGSGADKPLSVRAGMIRQMMQEQAPNRPIVAIGNKALVIGDPPSGLPEFPPLSGARAEAEVVERQLKRAFEVKTRIQESTPGGSLPAILAGRWRVLHLAGHGAVDFEKNGRLVTGMALENGMFFTPDNVAQMAAIPEFVFLNCCFLGSVDPDAEQRASARYHELAANLGTAFIKLGARAVVAAGWAVDDAAARLFADVLYARLLDGETFGWASFEARRTIYDTFGVSNNTWGAYQCYGDPGFRLFADARPASMSVAERPYVHVGEAVTDVSNIMQDAETMALRDPAPLLQRLRAIRDKVEQGDPGWLEDAELGAALGEAYGAFGLLDEAIDAYATALRAENAKAPIRVIEQLANLQARRAARNNAADAEQIIRKSIGLVNNLPRLPDDQLTSERWSLLGSCYKRLAQVTTGEARLDALRQMALSYEHGFERGRKGSAFATYPLLNWLLATSLLALFEQGREPDDVDHRLQEAANQASAADRDDPNFWHAAALADVALGLALRRGSLDDEEQRTIIEAYLRAWRRGASAIKFASVLEQIEFVRAILCDDSGHARADLCHALSTIADRLRSVTGVS